MYAGIVIDTDNFLTKTGVRTFDAASYLRRSGADVVRVRKMFRSDMYTYRQLAEGVINSEIYMDHFAISTVDPKESDAPTVVAAKVANDLLNIEGIRASFVTTEKDGTVYMSGTVGRRCERGRLSWKKWVAVDMQISPEPSLQIVQMNWY